MILARDPLADIQWQPLSYQPERLAILLGRLQSMSVNKRTTLIITYIITTAVWPVEVKPLTLRTRNRWKYLCPSHE